MTSVNDKKHNIACWKHKRVHAYHLLTADWIWRHHTNIRVANSLWLRNVFYCRTRPKMAKFNLF